MCEIPKNIKYLEIVGDSIQIHLLLRGKESWTGIYYIGKYQVVL